MENPYKSPVTSVNADTPSSPLDRYKLAGAWLVVVGVVHLFLMNYFSSIGSFRAIDWSPMYLVVLGGLVMVRFWIAVILARIIGSFAIVLIIILVVVGIRGSEEGHRLTYGSFEIVDPTPWQVGVFVGGIAVTCLPMWWLLQTTMRDNQTTHEGRESEGLLETAL